MLSPRGKGAAGEAGAPGEATPASPSLTPRGSSLLGSLGKLLWTPSGAETPGRAPAPAGGDDASAPHSASQARRPLR